jgi:predicted ATPase
MTDTVFVGREIELQWLASFLEKAAGGKTQVVFITGEAGEGKSSLVAEFVRRAEEKDPRLIASLGECNAQTGIADPYLPFRQILTALTTKDTAKKSSPEAEKKKKLNRWRSFAEISTKTLLMLGPDLVGIFVPGAQIVGRIGMAIGLNTNLAGRISGQIGKKADKKDARLDPMLDQEKVFEQYTNVLKDLVKDRTLILVLDDLQWADSGSITLLFHLARQLEDSRLMIVGAYRPDEVALGRDGARHPLEPILNELKRYNGDIFIDLSQSEKREGQAFVDALVDSEPNKLDRLFREELYRHTSGQPLFTVELLRNLQERGSLVKDAAGSWVLGGKLDWEALPARVDGVISERLARLPADLYETLTVASVVGQEFAAQTVALVQKVDDRSLLRNLSRELSKRYLLIVEQAEIKIGQQYLSQYRFGHVLVQQYLYNEISPGERRMLHGEIAGTLENLYSGYTDQISVELAHHYEEAGNAEKAIAYLIQVGDGAFYAYAYNESIAAFTRALNLGEQAAMSSEQLSHVYLQLGRALELNKQFELALKNYDEMLAAAQKRQDRAMELAAKIAASTLYSTPTPVADAVKGEELSEGTLKLARELGDRAVESKALWNLQLVYLLQNKAAEAIDYGEKSLSIAREMDLTEQMAYVLSDLGWAYNVACQFERSSQRMEEGARLWRQLGNKTMLSNHLNTSLYGAFWMGKDEIVLSIAEESYQLSASIKEVWNQASARSFQGQVWFDQGEIDRALAALDESIQLAAKGHLIYEAWYRAMLCRVYGELGAAGMFLDLFRSTRVADKDIPTTSLRTGMLVSYALFEIASNQLEIAATTLADCRPDAPPWDTVVLLAKCRLALARSEFPAAGALAGSAVELARQFGLGQYLPEALLLQGRCHLLQGNQQEAKRVLEQACSAAGTLGSRRLLWQIFAALAELEPEPEQSTALRARSGEIIQAIASTITSPELKEAFLRSAAIGQIGAAA